MEKGLTEDTESLATELSRCFFYVLFLGAVVVIIYKLLSGACKCHDASTVTTSSGASYATIAGKVRTVVAERTCFMCQVVI